MVQRDQNHIMFELIPMRNQGHPYWRGSLTGTKNSVTHGLRCLSGAMKGLAEGKSMPEWTVIEWAGIQMIWRCLHTELWLTNVIPTCMTSIIHDLMINQIQAIGMAGKGKKERKNRTFFLFSYAMPNPILP